MVGFIRDAASGFPLWRSSMTSTLLEMEIAINEFVLRATEKWNALLGKLHLPDSIRSKLEIDTTDTNMGLVDARNKLRAEAEKRTGLRAGVGTGPAPGSGGVRLGTTVTADEANAFGPPAPPRFEVPALPVAPSYVPQGATANVGTTLPGGPTTIPFTPGANTTNVTLHQENKIAVTVPPGTTPRDAQAFGSAVGGAASGNNRSALQALTQRAGK
jgi:hypothetical protein